MTVSKNNEQMDDDLSALNAGESRSWVQIGLLLDQVEQSSYWQKTSGSFTEWLKALSPAIGLKEASLWRYLSATRYFEKLRTKLIASDVFIPPLHELSDKLSPENVEILSKLSRVTPIDVFQSLATQVVDGTITRAELRHTWQAYRPALEGKTARGKGVVAPIIDPKDPSKFDSIAEAQILTSLSAKGYKWAGITRPDRYELFINIFPEFPLGIPVKFSYDAVAAVRARKSDFLVLHGIVIKTGGPLDLSDAAKELQVLQTAYCDFLWFAYHESTNKIAEDTIPKHIGLLIVTGDKTADVKIVRQAERAPESGLHAGELAKGLLLKVLGR